MLTKPKPGDRELLMKSTSERMDLLFLLSLALSRIFLLEEDLVIGLTGVTVSLKTDGGLIKPTGEVSLELLAEMVEEDFEQAELLLDRLSS